MTNLSRQDAAHAIEAARSLDHALLPFIGEYDDGTLMATDVKAWKDAGVAVALRNTRARIERALRNIERAD